MLLTSSLVPLKAAPAEILGSELRETGIAVAGTPAFQRPDASVNTIAVGGLAQWMRAMRIIHRVSWRDARTPQGGALFLAFET
ncbi:hypothetical protein Y032_0048g1624 [Ancylostoma ceylanicum]|uniref:Uncharacterized protein n=1 Tax=Ancylostoma ceylanicum TaxID=53326 RepID=A0A016UBB9_9BILA|nr:hypothetical protein Y032_0048g1624 [Ancylostoma ceylanicum]